MSIAEQVVPHLPYLRRFARALSGSQAAGDAYVVSVLEALVADSGIFDRDLSPRAALYKVFARLWNAVPLNNAAPPAGDAAPDRKLDALTPLSRQAFLLTSMERFETEDAAAIIGCRPDEFELLLAKAHQEISAQIATDVLIIEDEPLIAMDLEAIMEEIGHRVIGIARTHSEALKIAKGRHVGLILADIQLADGSSGIDAVNDLLVEAPAPVIFITAFPERLLTGQRAEPTYLIAKPFQASLVAGIASQALFFEEKAKRVA